MSLRPIVIYNKVQLFDDIHILCDNLPPDFLEHLCNNKLIITGAKAIPYDIAMKMSDHVESDAQQTYMTLQKQWPNV